MKSGPSAVTSTSTSSMHHWVPTSLREPPNKYQKISSTSSAPVHASLKMKTTARSRKRHSPKATTLDPLPAISTIFDSGSSSHSSSSNSSYGSYCQFSPEGSYTMYHLPMNYIPYLGEPTITVTASTSTMASPAPLMNSPPMSADEHKPINQPLFIQTAEYPYDYSVPDPTGGYPSSATINASQLLLRPVPNGHA
ncbi:hypothetical protein GCK72_017493 [Caenorhabditis remanei]|uniref:Uncharacterized protein n=1 Tax=Caenorhabditis remanei TaxID=31234 RepID=A0A6A5G8M7_CAERE|nr:hypothetical protein GCK72_017493 [Caenorhabditis remanei]KAF1750942.1 hypothetical protein GCK72_017493 [Caenorhabditis remanei]